MLFQISEQDEICICEISTERINLTKTKKQTLFQISEHEIVIM
jgi:hypothetical protein